jgi:autotransporter-associated beta strand protein
MLVLSARRCDARCRENVRLPQGKSGLAALAVYDGNFVPPSGQHLRYHKGDDSLRRSVVFFAAFFLVVIANNGPVAEAATLYWDGDGNANNNNINTGAGLGGTGNWSSNIWFDGTNDIAWTDGSDAVFYGPTANVHTLGTSRSVNSLTFKTTGYLLQDYLLNLAGPSITVDASVAATIAADIRGTAGLVKNGPGALHPLGPNGYTGGTTINGGTLGIVTGSLGALPAVPNTNITINNGATLRFNAADIALNPYRQILLGPGGGVINTNGNSGSIAGIISGSSLTKSGTGALTLTGPSQYADGTTISSGALLITNTQGSGTGTGNVNVGAGAFFGGSGTAAGQVTNNGTITPGVNTGTLNIGGTYTQGIGGKLEIELASISVHDRLVVNSTAVLAGNLTVVLTNGFTPQAGDTFTVLTALLGLGGTQFATTNLPALPGSLGWSVNYSTNSVRLSVTVAGDFNGNGTVDGADYVVWRNGLGTTFQQSDYGVWRSHFGQSASAATSAGAVPEPTSCLLLAVGAVLLRVAPRHLRRF